MHVERVRRGGGLARGNFMASIGEENNSPTEVPRPSGSRSVPVWSVSELHAAAMFDGRHRPGCSRHVTVYRTPDRSPRMKVSVGQPSTCTDSRCAWPAALGWIVGQQNRVCCDVSANVYLFSGILSFIIQLLE